jgi:regulator of replication initiation timing
MDNDDIFNRIFDKLDTFEERLDTTCTNVTEIKTTLNDFIVAVNKKEIEIKDNIERRYKNITVVFATITTISVLISIGKAFGFV